MEESSRSSLATSIEISSTLDGRPTASVQVPLVPPTQSTRAWVSLPTRTAILASRFFSDRHPLHLSETLEGRNSPGSQTTGSKSTVHEPDENGSTKRQTCWECVAGEEGSTDTLSRLTRSAASLVMVDGPVSAQDEAGERARDGHTLRERPGVGGRAKSHWRMSKVCEDGGSVLEFTSCRPVPSNGPSPTSMNRSRGGADEKGRDRCPSSSAAWSQRRWRCERSRSL